MHNEGPLQTCRAEPCSADALGRVEPCSTDEKQPTSGRLYQGGSIEQQRQRARRTAMWVGAIAVLVYVGFILSGVIGR
ncbi:hypothetical protein JY471_11955 [Stenotrophomonas maltophilia]|uniref:hypothetical protein n=1 Tax=Stenotrophomonas maltophilia TaxID=40324 RepID=UPI000810A100|nr:hypothetical protein [Stenotrophomonas maltophilia]MBH1496371.1 hypothetical protein [Stenotrophomonas maltophilia]MBN4963538.1 hypothetical protein [Stenotrophomonas maltophilia]MBN5143243.1 hypothetical protein [Stenotrophomonas maltophilia]OCK45353.1 hypothetical protein BA766_19570 [Stenotrophomonas maltophilia]PJK95222.1 hypothetical protein B9Y63_21305 [Stenotrophomonas maltophilia]